MQPRSYSEGFLFARRENEAHIRILRAEDTQHVRQRIVGNVDDIAAAGGMNAGAHSGRPGRHADRGFVRW